MKNTVRPFMLMFGFVFFVSALMISLGPISMAAEEIQQQIIVGSGTGQAGETVKIPIRMTSNGNITALQLRIAYAQDTFELLEVEKGAGLDTSFSLLANPDNGKLVIGSLGSAIESGTQEIAIAVFQIKADVIADTYEVKLTEAAFTDSEANDLSSHFEVIDGSLTLGAGNSGNVPVTGITLEPTALRLTENGAAGVLTAAVSPANATNQQVIWSSSDQEVAVVVEGVVTPLAAGTAVITAMTADGNFTAESAVVVTEQAQSEDEDDNDDDRGDGDGDSPPPDQPDSSIPLVNSPLEAEIWVNGKAGNAGTVTTTTVEDQQVTTMQFDSQMLENLLATEPAGTLITIPAKFQSDVVVGEFDGQMIKNMEQKQAIVKVSTDNATYTLPAEQINISAVSEQLGREVELRDIRIQVAIARTTTEELRMVESSAAEGGFTLVAPPLQFSVKGSLGDQAFDVTSFNAYVERTIAIPEGVNPDDISTGVVVDTDGTVRHIPTQIIEADGSFYARMNSRTNSTYAVISKPLAFKDVEEHWSKEAVNDMGSRLVISGVGEDMFQPNRYITRAEFAAIIVRGLGLEMEKGTSPFADVRGSVWYHNPIYTAYSHNLISGYEDGTFRPNDPISREEAMVIIAKAMELTELASKLLEQPVEEVLESFKDADVAAGWAVESIAANIQAGVVAGRSEDQLAPKAWITRAEVAVIVQRLLQQSDLI